MSTADSRTAYSLVRIELGAGKKLFDKFKETGVWPEPPEEMKGWTAIRNTFPSDSFFLTPEEIIIQENYEKTNPEGKPGVARLAPELTRADVIFRGDPKQPGYDQPYFLLVQLNDLYPEEAEEFAKKGLKPEDNNIETILFMATLFLGIAGFLSPGVLPWLAGKTVISYLSAVIIGGSVLGLWYSTQQGKEQAAGLNDFLNNIGSGLQKAGAGVINLAQLALIGGGLYILYSLLVKK